MSDVKKTCISCGSENVWKDANAEWCDETQSWVLKNTFDEDYCDDCDCSTTIVDAPLRPALAAE